MQSIGNNCRRPPDSVFETFIRGLRYHFNKIRFKQIAAE